MSGTKSAMEMTAVEYREARRLAVLGRLPEQEPAPATGEQRDVRTMTADEYAAAKRAAIRRKL